MNNWREITNAARDASGLMMKKPADGEKEFEQLLKYYPNDGMIYYQRGLAYEVLENFDAALKDFERAEVLFPLLKFKNDARDAADRVRRKKQ